MADRTAQRSLDSPASDEVRLTEQTFALGDRHGFELGVGIQLRQHVTYVASERVDGDVETLRSTSRVHSLRHQCQHLGLSVAQRRVAGRHVVDPACDQGLEQRLVHDQRTAPSGAQRVEDVGKEPDLGQQRADAGIGRRVIRDRLACAVSTTIRSSG